MGEEEVGPGEMLGNFSEISFCTGKLVLYRMNQTKEIQNNMTTCFEFVDKKKSWKEKKEKRIGQQKLLDLLPPTEIITVGPPLELTTKMTLPRLEKMSVTHIDCVKITDTRMITPDMVTILMLNSAGYWHPVEAGPCQEGYYCPNGTLQPIPCPDNTMKNYTGGYGKVSDCHPCLPGRFCLNGN